MGTPGKRIRAARKGLHLTQQQVAERLGVSREAVSLWEADRYLPETAKLPELARLLRTTIDSLVSGRSVAPHAASSDLSPYRNTIRFAPLISWVRAGEFTEAIDNHEPGDAEMLYPMPRAAGPRTFCLRVEGDSMSSQHGRTYPAGCIIFVDPDVDPAPGRRVVARLLHSTEVTFKTLVQESGQRFLRPLNPQYPAIHEPFEVIGVVIGKWEDE